MLAWRITIITRTILQIRLRKKDDSPYSSKNKDKKFKLTDEQTKYRKNGLTVWQMDTRWTDRIYKFRGIILFLQKNCTLAFGVYISRQANCGIQIFHAQFLALHLRKVILNAANTFLFGIIHPKCKYIYRSFGNIFFYLRKCFYYWSNQILFCGEMYNSVVRPLKKKTFSVDSLRQILCVQYTHA